MDSFRQQWQDLCQAIRHKPDLNLPDTANNPEPQDVADAITATEPWMSEGLQEFSARADALLMKLDKTRSADALSALLDKMAGTEINSVRVLQLKWGCHHLLAAREMSAKQWQLHQSADPGFQNLMIAGFEAFHLIWLDIGRENRLKHPLAALIEGWLTRPETIRPDVKKNGRPRKKGIMPSGLFPQQPATISAQLALSFDNGDPTLGRVDSSQAQLPLFADLLGSDDIPVTPLLLANAAGFSGLQPGRGARLDKRLLIFSLLSMPLDQRRPGGRYEWRPTLREIRDLLWPVRNKAVNGRSREISSYRPSKHARSLHSALQAINLAEIVMPDGYHWRPAIVRGYPSFDNLDSKVIVQIELPGGSDRGPVVDRPNLIESGTISDPAFDVELGLAYLWDEAKRRNGGYRIRATRPEAQRNKQGHIVDKTGSVQTEDNGKPATRWNHPKAVLTGRQERHPQADKVRVLTREERRRMAYGIAGQKTRPQLANERKVADQLLAARERTGRLVIERNAVDVRTGKKGWRILEAWHVG